MKIGISGANGQLGTATIEHLKARVGEGNIVGISRTPEKVSALGIEARFGDFDRPESLDEAFKGLDRLLLIPTDNLMPGVRAMQGRAAIERAVRAGTGHIVFMSALGTRAASSPHLWESYFASEQALIARAKSWTIVRMATYAESLADEVKMLRAQGVHASTTSRPVNFVSRDDVAAAAAGLLATGGGHGAIYQATGPTALDGEARAAAIAHAAKSPFAFARVTTEQYRQGLQAAGFPPHIVDAILSIQDMWAVGGYDVTTGDVELLSGRRPRDLVDVLTAALA
jgi:NAD(P)H dehydrogenase (quinone)